MALSLRDGRDLLPRGLFRVDLRLGDGFREAICAERLVRLGSEGVSLPCEQSKS